MLNNKLRKDVLYHFKMVSRLYNKGVPLIEALSVFCIDNFSNKNSFLRVRKYNHQSEFNKNNQEEFDNGKKDNSLKLNWKNILIDKLRSGKTFGQSINEMGLPVRNYELTIINKSEDAGKLSVGLNRIYEMNQEIDIAKNKLLMALVYPLIILMICGALILAILLIIIPKIRPLFASSKIAIPFNTRILFFASDNIAYILIVCVLVIFALIVSSYFLIKKRGRAEFNNLILNYLIKFPIIGSLIKHYSSYISFRIASEVFSSSGLLVESLRDSAVGSIIPKEKIKLLNVANEVESGVPLSKSLGRVVSVETKIWIPLVVCGEETGTISETFSSISEIHREFFNEKMALVNKMIEPLSMILVGLGVGFIALSIITPIYSLVSYTGY